MDDSELDFVDLCSKLLKRVRKKEPAGRPSRKATRGDKRAVDEQDEHSLSGFSATGSEVVCGGTGRDSGDAVQSSAFPPADADLRAKGNVLLRMQEFKRASPQKMMHSNRIEPAKTDGRTLTAQHQKAGNLPESDEALALRLQRELDREAAEAQMVDLEDGGLFFCQICHRDLSHMTPDGRTQHLNRCLDQNEQSALSLPPPSAVPNCPICGKKFKSQKSRSAHLKRCSADMGVSPAVLLQALQRQAEESRSSKLSLFPLPSLETGGIKRKGPPQPELPARKKPRKKADRLDEDTMVALALSSSLLEQQKEQQVQSGSSHRRVKKKKVAVPRPPPLLLVQDAETALARLQERVTALLLRRRSPSPPTPTRRPSKLPCWAGAAPLWRKSTLLGGGSTCPSQFYAAELQHLFTAELSKVIEENKDSFSCFLAIFCHVALSKLSSDLSSMVNNPQLSDVQLQVDSGEVYFAHSFMVYARFLVAFTLNVCVSRFDLQELERLCHFQPENMAAGDDRLDVNQEENVNNQTDQTFVELLRSMWNEEDSDGDERVNEEELEEIYEFAATQRQRVKEEEEKKEEEEDAEPEPGSDRSYSRLFSQSWGVYHDGEASFSPPLLPHEAAPKHSARTLLQSSASFTDESSLNLPVPGPSPWRPAQEAGHRRGEEAAAESQARRSALPSPARRDEAELIVLSDSSEEAEADRSFTGIKPGQNPSPRESVCGSQYSPGDPAGCSPELSWLVPSTPVRSPVGNTKTASMQTDSSMCRTRLFPRVDLASPSRNTVLTSSTPFKASPERRVSPDNRKSTEVFAAHRSVRDSSKPPSIISSTPLHADPERQSTSGQMKTGTRVSNRSGQPSSSSPTESSLQPGVTDMNEETSVPDVRDSSFQQSFMDEPPIAFNDSWGLDACADGDLGGFSLKLDDTEESSSGGRPGVSGPTATSSVQNPARQMVLKLKEIHQYTHQLTSSEEEEGEEAGLPLGRAVSCARFKEPTAPAAAASPVRTDQEEAGDPLSASQGSNVFPVTSSLSADSDVSSSQAASCLQDRLQAVRSFILSDSDLYSRILQYQPLVLSQLQQRLKAAGVRLGAAKLVDYLDSQCITFTTAKPGHQAAGRRRGAWTGRGARGGGRRNGASKR
uniref:Structure-specific endonuclease subunit SLX4 n=1 Tax=Xiphophorus couchianus TaxID=32473 RepID=A0A3B5M7E9_9TELE